MKKVILNLAILSILFSGSSALAEIAQGKILSLGCHNIDDTCYVTIDGYNPTVCNKMNSIRWSAGTSFGKRWFAMLLAAQVAGKSVQLEVPSNSCSSQGMPTFNWGQVF